MYEFIKLDSVYKIATTALSALTTILVGIFVTAYFRDMDRKDMLYDRVISNLERVAESTNKNAHHVDLIKYDTGHMKSDINNISNELDTIKDRQRAAEQRQEKIEGVVNGLDQTFSKYWPEHRKYDGQDKK